MSVSIDWGTSIISIPKAYLTLVGGANYTLDTNVFRLDLKDLEDDLEGIGFLKTHEQRTSTVTLSGIDYARIIEILAPYTITFEDGQYRVVLIGSNNNILDVTNINQVSVSSTNSAGLITSTGIQAIEYGRQVTIDVTSSNTGTTYPVGTPRFPVNNLADSEVIATTNGFTDYFIMGNITFEASDNIDGITIKGEHPTKTLITLTSGVSTIKSEFENLTLVGDIGGAVAITFCHIQDLDDFGSTVSETAFHNCLFESPTAFTLKSTATEPIVIIDNQSHNAVHGNGAVFDMNGASCDFIVTNWSGSIEIIGMTNAAQNVSINMNQGDVIIDSSCTAGNITVHGTTMLSGTGGGVTIDKEGVENKTEVANAVWDETMADHLIVGSTGEKQNTGGAGDPAAIAAAVWDEDLLTHLTANSSGEMVASLKRLFLNRMVINTTSSRMEIYDEAGTSIIFQLPLTDKDGNSITLKRTGSAVNRGNRI